MDWEYDLETRHEGIDKDHWEVVAALSRFLSILDAGPPEHIAVGLRVATERVARHFAFEEQLMDGLPAYAAARDHKAAHGAFLADMKRFGDQLAKDGVTESFRQWAHGRLVSWFKFHIKAYDVALAKDLAPSTSSAGTAKRPA